MGDRFCAVVATHPERIALRSPAGAWTYEQLASAVKDRAGALQASLGIETPQPVAVLAAHDGPLVMTIMSVILAGHIVVVLDPMAPAELSLHVLRESGAQFLLHDADNSQTARDLVEPSEVLATPCRFDALEAAPWTPPDRGAGDPVMLAFTSGTSGESKGAVITHGVLLNLVRGATNALGIDHHDRMPMLFPTSLAVAAYPMFLPLLNGGTLATLDVRSVGLAPIADFLADERITLAYMAPTVIRFLADSLDGRHFPDLRMIALGGEVVDAEVVRLTVELLGPRLLANGFGTTETGVITLHVFGPEEVPENATVPVGHPVPDLDLQILDDRGQEVPLGISGEVAIASPYVFTGYWGHPELTAQVVAPDPHGRPGWMQYRTGDLGRIDEHGALVVLGRLDTKVKIRGRFVVLGDVEADINALDEVAGAAVVAVERNGVNELVAIVVASAGAVVDATALRAELLSRREAYRVPSRWNVVDALPLLPNGKTDRQALQTMEAVTPARPAGPAEALEDEYASRDAPERDRLARALRDIWELLLPAPVIGLNDDFAHLGGDSLTAAQMLVMVDEQLGVTVPMGELVHARTIRELVEVILRLRRVGDLGPPVVSCVQEGDPAARPRLWFVHDLQGSAYRVRHLAEALGADQPVWSFESPLLRGEPNRYTTLDEFAARYVRDLRASQPEGPYWLGGYSFGGICAYEMARQLARDGEEVALCSVVDVGPGYRGFGWSDKRSPFRPWFGVGKPPEPGSPWRAQMAHYRDMVKASPKGAARHLMVRSGLARVVDPIRFQEDLRRHGRVRPKWRLWYAWEEHWKLAAKRWDRTNHYDGHVDLLWADDTPATDDTMGWAPLVRELTIHRFHGDHEGTLEPRGAPALAAALRSVIDDRIASFDDVPPTEER